MHILHDTTHSVVKLVLVDVVINLSPQLAQASFLSVVRVVVGVACVYVWLRRICLLLGIITVSLGCEEAERISHFHVCSFLLVLSC